MSRADHWQTVFTTKGEHDVSWFEPVPEVSLQLMEAAGLRTNTCVIDIGGGDSHLVDALLDRGLTCVAVLDVSSAALQRAQERLGPRASVPTWMAADVTGDWTHRSVDIWHDRAVFHFLTSADERARYRAHLDSTLVRGGAAIIATFALDGPEKCSGLPVRRYSPESLAAELGPAFSLVEAVSHVHHTPWGASQSFQYARFTKLA